MGVAGYGPSLVELQETFFGKVAEKGPHIRIDLRTLG
jgi:hypothetical protein